MLLDLIAEILAKKFDCPCNYGNTDIFMSEHLSEKWFEEFCHPEYTPCPKECWKTYLLLELNTGRPKVTSVELVPRMTSDTGRHTGFIKPAKFHPGSYTEIHNSNEAIKELLNKLSKEQKDNPKTSETLKASGASQNTIKTLSRPKKDAYYLAIAKSVALRSTCLHRQYGAVIVNNDEIISAGYNGSPRGEVNCCDVGICYRDTHKMPKDPLAGIHGNQYGSCVAVHAEQNAIINASRKDMQGATLYLASLDGTAIAPCNMCDRMIKNAGIVRVVTK